jgi:hypothetical protein
MSSLGALPFVTVGEKNELSVNEGALEYLQTLDGPVSVVSAVGLYRSGKSSLLNWMLERRGLLKNDGAGFAIGSTVNRCTRGIWIWSEPIPDDEGGHIVLMDTEGLGGVEADSDYDTRIFSLSVLLSSEIIYNSRGSIDETAIGNLAMVTKLSNFIHLGTNETSEKGFCKLFPSFTWVVRDFSLVLEDEDGIPITSKEYIDMALEPKDGYDEATLERNNIRNSITEYFTDIDCHTMVMPVVDESKDPGSMSINDLRENFQKSLDRLIDTTFHSHYKTVGGDICTGSTIAGLAKAYVHAISTGAVPTVATAWHAVSARECDLAANKALEDYTRWIEEAVVTPREEQKMNELHEKFLTKALTQFDLKAVGPSAEKERVTLTAKIEDLREHIHQLNIDASRKLCEELYTQASMKVNEAFPPIPPAPTLEEGEDFTKLLKSVAEVQQITNVWKQTVDTYISSGASGPEKWIVPVENGVTNLPHILAAGVRRSQQNLFHQVADLRHEHAELIRLTELAKIDEKRSSADIKTEQDRLETLESQLHAARDINASGNSGLTSAKQHHDKLVMDLKDLKNEIEDTKQNISEYKKKLLESKKRLTDSQIQYGDLTEEEYEENVREADMLTTKIAHKNAQIVEKTKAKCAIM